MPMSLYSQAVSGVHYKCSPCIGNYYTTGVGHNTLIYDKKGNTTLKEKWNWNYNCLPCPYAICTGNNVIPRPNYWGYWHDSELVFQQCPADYCCSGSDSSICDVYNHCPGNKTGTLCGDCKEGFSVSILSGMCIPDNKCGNDKWFWILVILAAMAYALWHTLKDDIFALIFHLINF